MITQRHLERDGDRLLWRIAVDGAAVLDVLTDAQTLARVRAALEGAPTRGLTEERLGAFGPFDVTMSTTDGADVALAIDGPDLGKAFRGHQAVIFYLDRLEMLKALQLS